MERAKVYPDKKINSKYSVGLQKAFLLPSKLQDWRLGGLFLA
jgi:hypothetical protein